MNNWKAGDSFVFVQGDPNTGGVTGRHRWVLGSTGTIVALTAERQERFTVHCDLLPYPQNDRWGGWSVHPSWLAPLPGANEKTSWSECAWQPKELVTV